MPRTNFLEILRRRYSLRMPMRMRTRMLLCLNLIQNCLKKTKAKTKWLPLRNSSRLRRFSVHFESQPEPPGYSEAEPREVWKEDVDVHAFEDCASDDGSLKSEGRGEIVDDVKDIVVDDVKYKNDHGLEFNKDIGVDDGTNKQELVIDGYEKSRQGDALCSKSADLQKKVESKSSEQKSSDDVGGNKPENSVVSPPRRNFLRPLPERPQILL
ncbi:hypothetical protein MLD38_024994 [Melastoma candidum]|uniref:Uncharacterized protein n=1 Tax=Melastoma candidum TaxID=119954 RepID=A0ACB9NZ60_9MYRT|nr:hypothetical protein MLD38_024994 [Melastoma candidum]